jgi:hypothetical protein
VALPLYQSIVSEHADHAGAQFALGRVLLSRQQAAGIEAIETAMRLDSDAILLGCQMIYVFLIGQQRDQEAQRYYERAAQRAQLLEAAQAERARLDLRDRYLPHGLSDAQVAQLREQLARNPEIAEAYIVRKELQHSPEQPLYALGIVARRKAWYRARTPRDDATLAKQIAQQLRFSGETFIVVLNTQNAQMKKILRRVPGSRI